MRSDILKKMAVMALAVSMLTAGCNKAQAPAPAPEEKQETPAPEAKSEEKPEEKAEEPKKEEAAGAREIPQELYEETEHKMTTDTEGCATFTNIVDKLEDGKGYVNTDIGDTNVLMVTSGTYQWEDNVYGAIDAEIFMYKDGEDAPAYLGAVEAGGTAYPLSLKDGLLYVGGNHFMKKYAVKNGELVAVEEAYVIYDSEGNAEYYYRTDSTKFEDYDSETAEGHLDSFYQDMDSAEVINFDTVGGVSGGTGALPAYEYPGPELFYSVVYKYLIDEFGSNYEASDVTIPCPIIIAEDESDKSDIKLYGNFWIFNYDLNGETLENTSGGSYPGVIHIDGSDADYVVKSMEVVEDGSNYDSSAKKIFGKYYDDFVKSGEDKDAFEKTRAQIIANYVFANDLSIKEYKDYGWDPVKLPEENIDSFYSVLD